MRLITSFKRSLCKILVKTEKNRNESTQRREPVISFGQIPPSKGSGHLVFLGPNSENYGSISAF